MIASTVVKETYPQFQNRWQFGWEKKQIIEPIKLTPEEIETIKNNHQKILEQAKKNGRR